MGEERGSPGLRISVKRTRICSVDVFIASDGPRIHPDKPTIFMDHEASLILLCDLIHTLADIFRQLGWAVNQSGRGDGARNCQYD